MGPAGSKAFELQPQREGTLQPSFLASQGVDAGPRGGCGKWSEPLPPFFLSWFLLSKEGGGGLCRGSSLQAGELGEDLPPLQGLGTGSSGPHSDTREFPLKTGQGQGHIPRSLLRPCPSWGAARLDLQFLLLFPLYSLIESILMKKAV